MGTAISIENENTFRAEILNGMNLFAGSGFSVLASDAHGKPLPVGTQLVAELAHRFRVRDGHTMDLDRLVTVIEHTHKRDLQSFLKRRFAVSDFDDAYYVMPCLPFQRVFTTNIDDLLHKVYAQSGIAYLNDVYVNGPSYGDASGVDYVPLHGCVQNDDRPYVFDDGGVAAAFGDDPQHWGYLAQQLAATPTLFWGYSFTDPGTRTAFHQLRGHVHSDHWVVVHPQEEDKRTLDYFGAKGFQIIRADTRGLLDYLGDLESEVSEQAEEQDDTDTRALFPDEAIPHFGEVTKRPIVDYFIGAEPQWSDVYSQALHRTGHYRTVMDAVNSGQHALIVGVPACGKTTLLMQIAAAAKINKHKIMPEWLTPEKARMLVSRLDHRPALVFIDNLADSVQGVRELTRSENIQIVAAERDYNFEIVRHLLDMKTWTILDVTELTPADIQTCLSSIPQDIRAGRLRVLTIRPASGSLTQPSLFELIERNLKMPRLKKRFQKVLEQLHSEATPLMDLLIMVCYVFSCRTPVSMDMMMSFLRDDITDHHDAYEFRRKLGGMVAEYFGEFADTNQDHFMPRSSLVGEAVMAAASSPDLRRVLTRFHTNVSPVSICRFKAFRTRAYDNDLMGRAFPNWEEGLDFYDRLYVRDDSPYVLQQQALYLSKKHRYDEAFSSIDRAVVRSGRSIWAIQNSHAIILFNANISKPDEPEAQSLLQRSMEILKECYESDRRKPYHACTFGSQALEYWKTYGDAEALDYLVQAREWLGDERARSPWNRMVQKRLLEVARVIKSEMPAEK